MEMNGNATCFGHYGHHEAKSVQTKHRRRQILMLKGASL